MTKVESIILDAQSLPPEDRIRIVDSLLQSIAPSDPEIERAWLAESRRRLNEIESGNVETVPLEVVMARLRERFPER